MEKVTRKYALENSYFKNCRPSDPDTILQIAQYYQKHKEWPFKYTGNNGIYDAFCERQKRHQIVGSQFLTPDRTALRMAVLAKKYNPGDKKRVLDACCGTGQISKSLADVGFVVEGFDINMELVETCKVMLPSIVYDFYYADYRDFDAKRDLPTLIVSNPPYEIKHVTAFFHFLISAFPAGGVAVLLLARGMVDKQIPKALMDAAGQFKILHREDMKEPFVHTALLAEILVLEKLFKY